MFIYCYSHSAKTSLKRKGYCWGIVGVNGAKTRAHVISLDKIYLQQERKFFALYKVN